MNSLTIEEKLQQMTLAEYITAFGSVVDQNPDHSTFKKRIPFSLWKRQLEACNFADVNLRSLWPKSRQKGLSELAAERALKTLLQNENIEGVAISKSERFAEYFLSKRIVPKFREMERKYPGMFPEIIHQTKEEVIWEGGRSIKSIASSSTAAASLTLDFIIFDEAGGIDSSNANFEDILSNSLPACSQNKQAWIMIIGTSVPGSHYNYLVKKAWDNKNTGSFKYFFIGWFHQPGRDKAWYLGQKDEQGDNVYLQEPSSMDDFFFIKDGLVFHHFDSTEDGRHVINFNIGEAFVSKTRLGTNTNRCSWLQTFITSYDHGTKHPAVNLYTLYDSSRDKLYVFDELFFIQGHGKNVEEIIQFLKQKSVNHQKQPNKQIADGAIFNDTGVKSIGTIFKKAGFPFKAAKKHNEAASRDLLSTRFRKDTIFIHPKCVNLIDQLRTYTWDPKSKGEKPIDRDDDAIDALRYICAELKVVRAAPIKIVRDTGYTTYEQTNTVDVTNGDQSSNGTDWQAY